MLRAKPLLPLSRSRRRALAGLGGAGLTALAGLAGCTPPTSPLRVGCIVFPGYELMFLARELGLLPERQVRLVELSANTDVLRALSIEQLEAAALTLDEMLTARADGVDLRLIGVLDVSDGSDVILGRRGITQLTDLAGRRVGVEDTATGALMLAGALRAVGMTVNQVRKVRLALGQTTHAMDTGVVDAVVTAEPWASGLQAQGAVRLFDSRQIPGSIVDVLVARADVCRQRGGALHRLLSAHFQALSRYQADPLAAAPLMAARLQVEPADVAQTLLGLELPDARRNRALLSEPQGIQASAERLVELMLQERLLTRSPALKDWIDPRFLPSS